MKKESGWRPKPAVDAVDGYETWTHTGPGSINEQETEPDISLTDDDEADE